MERLLRKKDNKGRFLLNENGIICYKHVIANFTHKGFIYIYILPISVAPKSIDLFPAVARIA